MMLTFDPPRTCGDLCFTVLSECRVSVHPLNRGIVGHASKRPSALVFLCNGKLTATDLKGRPIDSDKLMKSCPGLVEALNEASS